ncbi:MAG TPA: phospholipid carrier-dependent glycosyltransferase [Chloroflexota bacterium]|nr:phospholipid carrier-dependent glycosyltransferase [Chloroflexota bacterium]
MRNRVAERAIGERAAAAESGAQALRPAGWGHLSACLAIFALALGIYLLTLPADLRNNADTVDRFSVTKALIHGHVSVQCPAPGKALHPPLDSRLAIGRHGCYYAKYAPGQTVLMTPLYVVGKGISAVTGLSEDFSTGIASRSVDPILGALTLVLFFLLALDIGYRRRTAILLTIVLAFASTLWPDVQSGQEQTQATLALVAAVYCGIRARGARPSGTASAENDPPGGRARASWLLAAGAAVGFGLFTRYDFVILALPVFVWLMLTLGPRPGQAGLGGSEGSPDDRGLILKLEAKIEIAGLRTVAPFVLGVAPFVLLDAAWNAVRFGAPWNVGESATGQFGYPVWQGILNLLVSPGKGLLWYLPLLWLVPPAIGPFRQRVGDLVWLATALLVASLLFYGSLSYWHGDPAWGPRYLFPLVPLFVLPLGELFERFSALRLQVRTVILGVIGLSFAVQLASVTVDPWRFWYHLIEQRRSAGQLFQPKPPSYNYYWSSNTALDPLLYQFVAVKDVATIAFGDNSPVILEASPAPAAPWRQRCDSVPPTKVREYDTCQLSGFSLRPLNTVSPIWLSDRYQWVDPMPVPLSLEARVVIIALLLGLSGAGAMALHRQYWSPPHA